MADNAAHALRTPVNALDRGHLVDWAARAEIDQRAFLHKRLEEVEKKTSWRTVFDPVYQANQAANDEGIADLEAALPDDAPPPAATTQGVALDGRVSGEAAGFWVNPRDSLNLKTLFPETGRDIQLPLLNKTTAASVLSTARLVYRDTREGLATQLAVGKIRQETAARIRQMAQAPRVPGWKAPPIGVEWKDDRRMAALLGAEAANWLAVSPLVYAQPGDDRNLQRLEELGAELEKWITTSGEALRKFPDPAVGVIERDTHEGDAAFWRPPDYAGEEPASPLLPPPSLLRPQERYPFLFAMRLAMAGDELYARKYEFLMRYYLRAVAPEKAFVREQTVLAVANFAKPGGFMMFDMDNADDAAFFRAIDFAQLTEEGRKGFVDPRRLDEMFFGPTAPLVGDEPKYDLRQVLEPGRGELDSFYLGMLHPRIKGATQQTASTWSRLKKTIKEPGLVVNMGMAAAFSVAATQLDALAPSLTPVAMALSLVPMMAFAVPKLLMAPSWISARASEIRYKASSVIGVLKSFVPRANWHEPTNIQLVEVERQNDRDRVLELMAAAPEKVRWRDTFWQQTRDDVRYTDRGILVTHLRGLGGMNARFADELDRRADEPIFSPTGAGIGPEVHRRATDAARSEQERLAWTTVEYHMLSKLGWLWNSDPGRASDAAAIDLIRHPEHPFYMSALGAIPTRPGTWSRSVLAGGDPMTEYVISHPLVPSGNATVADTSRLQIGLRPPGLDAPPALMQDFVFEPQMPAPSMANAAAAIMTAYPAQTGQAMAGALYANRPATAIDLVRFLYNGHYREVWVQGPPIALTFPRQIGSVIGDERDRLFATQRKVATGVYGSVQMVANWVEDLLPSLNVTERQRIEAEASDQFGRRIMTGLTDRVPLTRAFVKLMRGGHGAASTLFTVEHAYYAARSFMEWSGGTIRETLFRTTSGGPEGTTIHRPGSITYSTTWMAAARRKFWLALAEPWGVDPLAWASAYSLTSYAIHAATAGVLDDTTHAVTLAFGTMAYSAVLYFVGKTASERARQESAQSDTRKEAPIVVDKWSVLRWRGFNTLLRNGPLYLIDLSMWFSYRPADQLKRHGLLLLKSLVDYVSPDTAQVLYFSRFFAHLVSA